MSTNPQPPGGQGPIHPQGAFTPPPFPGGMPPMPPPGMMPPGMMGPPGMFPPGMPYPPPRRRGGFGAFLRSIMLLLLIASLVANAIFISSSGMFGTDNSVESSIQSGDSGQKIAVIPVQGIIMPDTSVMLGKWIKTVEKDKNYKAVVLAVDTLGGAVTPSDDIWHYLTQLKQNRPGLPIVVSMGGYGTSGGYWVSTPADYIIAQPTTLTGNIGVIKMNFNVNELAKKIGLAETTVVAPANGFKNAGSMFKPETPEDRQYEQAMIDSIYARFVGHVKAGRKGKLKGKITEICDARAFTAQQALDYGLIDEIGFAEDAYAKAAKLASLQKPHIVKFQRRPSFFDLMGQDNQPPPSSRGNGGVNLSLHIDERAIEFFSGPKLMVLWQGQ